MEHICSLDREWSHRPSQQSPDRTTTSSRIFPKDLIGGLSFQGFQRADDDFYGISNRLSSNPVSVVLAPGEYTMKVARSPKANLLCAALPQCHLLLPRFDTLGYSS